MNKFFTIGAVAGWLLLSMIYGSLLPVLSLPTILAVAIGGVVGVIFGSYVSGIKKMTQNNIDALPAHNTANNDTRSFDMAVLKLKKKIGCARSTVLLTRNLSFDSSQNGGVVCRHETLTKKMFSGHSSE